LLERIGYTIRQRRLRPNDNDINMLLDAKSAQGLVVCRIKGNVFAQGIGAAISGCDKKPAQARRLSKFPGNRMFTATIPDQQDIHRSSNPGSVIS
jgi:hypothetical protein